MSLLIVVPSQCLCIFPTIFIILLDVSHKTADNENTGLILWTSLVSRRKVQNVQFESLGVTFNGREKESYLTCISRFASHLSYLLLSLRCSCICRAIFTILITGVLSRPSKHSRNRVRNRKALTFRALSQALVRTLRTSS